MDYEIVDINDKCEYLLTMIEDDCRKAFATRSQIERLKKARIAKRLVEEEFLEDDDEESYDDDLDDYSEDSFEDEVYFYLQDYRVLESGFSDDEFYDILPSRMNYNYHKIMQRLMAESIRDIKDIRECIYEDENLSKEELMEYTRLLENEKRKINMIKKISSSPVSVIEEEKKNTVILVPTEAFNIRVIDELEHVPLEYHARFRELIESIIDGTFKNVKCFRNNKSLAGIFEVKNFKARVVFTRISRNCYAIITAFIKKSDNDKGYAESLRSKVGDYKKNVDVIKTLQDNSEFMAENEKNIDYLLGLLSSGDKRMVKGGSDE